MHTINDILNLYYLKIDPLDLELLIAHAIKKPREFVLAHPEARVAPKQETRIKNYAKQRIAGKPLSYITGRKEFYGLNFKINKSTLIPRPETELLVELAIQEATRLLASRRSEPARQGNKKQEVSIIDIGTGSGNIIISLAKLLEETRLLASRRSGPARQGRKKKEERLFGIDINEKALQIAKHNAKKHSVDEKIRFLRGNLLEPIFKTKKFLLHNSEFIILANLPYLSRKIYSSADIGIKKYEPKSALLSANHGLAHYEKLLIQIKKLCVMRYALCIFMEISPEQKPLLRKLIKKYFPKAKAEFFKDLAGRWRVCQINF